MTRPTEAQVKAIMDRIVAPEEQQPRSVLVDFQRAQLEQTIRLLWPHIAELISHDAPPTPQR